VGRGQTRDRTILDWWLARQSRSWWRQWRWLVILLAVLALLRLAWSCFDAWCYFMQQSPSFRHFMETWAFKFWQASFDYARPVYIAQSLTAVALIVLAVASFVVRLPPPAEVALTSSIKALHARLLKRGRRLYWMLLLAFYLVPSTLATAWYLFLEYLRPDEASLGKLMLGGFSITNALVWVILLEWQIALMLKLPYRRAWLPLYAMPAALLVTVYVLLNTSSARGLLLFAPLPAWPSLPQAEDIWIAVLHVAAVLGGLVIAGRWWPYVINSGRPRKWWNLILVLWAGLLVPGLIWLSPDIWLSRVFYSVGAFFKGIYLGNPLAGWIEVMPLYANPYSFYWADYSSMMNNYQLINRSLDEVGIYSNEPHLILAPYLYVPLYAGIIWALLYYGYSLFIIWRANNQVPKSFRGTYEE